MAFIKRWLNVFTLSLLFSLSSHKHTHTLCVFHSGRRVRTCWPWRVWPPQGCYPVEFCLEANRHCRVVSVFCHTHTHTDINFCHTHTHTLTAGWKHTQHSDRPQADDLLCIISQFFLLLVSLYCCLARHLWLSHSPLLTLLTPPHLTSPVLRILTACWYCCVFVTIEDVLMMMMMMKCSGMRCWHVLDLPEMLIQWRHKKKEKKKKIFDSNHLAKRLMWWTWHPVEWMIF